MAACVQDIVKALFGDDNTNETLKLGAVNSINFSRILAQIVYYFHAYFSLARKSTAFKVGDKVRFVTPTGNFGNILAGYLATRMGLPADKLTGMYLLCRLFLILLLDANPLAVATNE